MLNTMSFYCQPILPLVYDESMSYYETLCKVVGQLNNTGETVNKLNEGLTREIADRQAGDAALDERLKQIEALNGRTHFLVFDGAIPSGAMPTRSELYNWVRNGDAIYTLFSTNESGRGQVYAASCSYNAGNWGSEASNDFNIIVPLETKYDSANDYAIKQKVAKLTIPPISNTSLNVPWGLQIIEVNTPSTSAEGVVNVTAVVSDSGSVNCSITPSEFLQLYNMTRGGKNLCVAVNAKLAYDGLARSSSIATVDTTNRIVRIAFERDFGTAITNGVNQLNKTLDYIIGDAKTGAWVHETIDSKIFDFIRYEGFQFTRGAHDVITTDDESTPNAVYAQYHSDTSGKLYQNLPTRLIDSVDGAEYWNGTFDIYGGNHMTFTFVTSNYATRSDKMLVRVIELSADVGTTAWKYGVKEFTLPLSGGETTTYVDFWGTGQDEVYSNDLKAWTITLATNQTFDGIFDLISSGANAVARLYKDSTKSELIAESVETHLSGDKTIGNIVFSFVHASPASPDVFLGFPTIADAIWVTKTSTATSVYALYKWCALPVPAGDSSDNGKVPTVNGAAWELKDQTSKPLYITIDVANIDERIYTLTDGNKTYTVEEIYAAKENGTPVFIAPADIGAYFQVLDFSFSNTVFKAFFLNVVRRTDMSYGRLTISTIGGQTKGTYIAEGFLAASSSANNGKFLKMKQDGSGIEYVYGFKYFTYDAHTTSAEMTPAEVKAFIIANPHTPIYMLITGIDTGTRPILAVQQSWANDTVVFVSTSITRTTGVQEYKLVKAASDTAWGTISTGRLVTDDTPSVANPTFAEDIDGHANIVLGVGEDSLASNENLPYLATGDYPKATIDGMTWSDLRLYNGVFAYRDLSIDSIYNKVLDGTMLPDIDFVLSNAVLIGTVEGEITNYNNGYYDIIKDEISRNRGNIWLSFNGETIRLASWKQAGSDTYSLTFFGAGAAAQPVKYVVTASASAATLTVTGS
jgi:hypothetical protein